jgi:hypothetical protein
MLATAQVQRGQAVTEISVRQLRLKKPVTSLFDLLRETPFIGKG